MSKFRSAETTRRSDEEAGELSNPPGGTQVRFDPRTGHFQSHTPRRAGYEPVSEYEAAERDRLRLSDWNQGRDRAAAAGRDMRDPMRRR
jgi:hypothetical protein